MDVIVERNHASHTVITGVIRVSKRALRHPHSNADCSLKATRLLQIWKLRVRGLVFGYNARSNPRALEAASQPF
jgi:hypothetical protein